jgi:hypothetical protein
MSYVVYRRQPKIPHKRVSRRQAGIMLGLSAEDGGRNAYRHSVIPRRNNEKFYPVSFICPFFG